MKLAEKIGYVLEHLIILELQKDGITIQRSEKPSNETIKGDISFTFRRQKYIVFSTHTRTQGMTNRKFYRSFEELAQRRVLEPKSICIDVSLVKNRANVRKQQPLIFNGLFDSTLSVVPSSQETDFIRFVQGLGKKVSLEITQESLQTLPKSIENAIKKAVTSIKQASRTKTSLVAKYWQLENIVKVGVVRVDTGSQTSVKKGMKALSLIPSEVSVDELTGRSCVLKKKISKEILSHLKRTGVCSIASPSLSGTRLILSEDAWAAIKFCRSQEIDLPVGWFTPYLTTVGAKRLHADLMDFSKTSRRTKELNGELEKVTSRSKLKRAFWKDYT